MPVSVPDSTEYQALVNKTVSLETRVAQLEGEIGSLKSANTSLAASLSASNAKIAVLETDVAALKATGTADITEFTVNVGGQAIRYVKA